MPRERWQQSEAIYHAALEGVPDERAAFLAAGGESLRREIEALLRQPQGKPTAVRQMLAEIYGWFTKGFATANYPARGHRWSFSAETFLRIRNRQKERNRRKKTCKT